MDYKLRDISEYVLKQTRDRPDIVRATVFSNGKNNT